MALTVGELLAVVDVDTTAMRSGLAQAEGDARRAGSNIGEGVTDGIADAGGEGAQRAGSGIASRLSDSLKAGLAGAGLAAGAVLAMGVGQALEQGKIVGKLGAQLGATPAEAEKYGKLAGRLYSNAVTEDFQTAADTISAVMRAGIAPPDATEAQLESLATKVSDVATTFELDLGQTANAVGQMLKTGLAKDGAEALDIITAGMQQMGPRADDLMDTFNEYSVQFQRLGLDATTATGLISQGMQAGARDTDVVADALKEFTIEAVAGSEKIAGGFEMVGLDADEMISKINEGGPKATEALQMTLDALRDMEDPVKRDAAAVELFGTKSEDMQAALLALDPSKAVTALGDVGGKADEMGNSLRDNAGVQVEQFKRQAMQGLVDFLGGTVIPALMDFAGFVREHQEVFKGFAAVITAVVIPVLLLLGGQAMWAGMQMAAAWIVALGPIAWVGLAIGALVVLIVAYWDEVKEWTLKAWGWVVDKLTWAKDMAIKAFTNFTLVGLIIKHWDTIRSKTTAAWNAVVDWVKGIPGRFYNAFLNWTLLGLVIKHWSSIKTATVNKAMEVVSWVRGLPGRISSAIGSLGNLLYGKGQDVVRGLLRGVQGMGGWLRSQLISFAKRMIPGPIAKALGIASPSRVMRDQIGRWIPAGIVDGIESGRGAVARTMATLVPTPSVSAVAPAMAGAGPGYAAGSPFGGAAGRGSLVQIEHWHAAENGGPEDNARALEWLAKARG